jgi:altronate hydrolase
LIQNFKAYYARNNQPCYENPSPGNKDGGITTLEEKSSGCVLKGGHLPVSDVIDVGEPIKSGGLTLVNGPGNDLVASTNVAASGATLIIFTTGRGTPYGSVVPTLKVATNHKMAELKKDWIDFDGEKVFEEGFLKARDELLDLVIAIASGKLTKEESNDMGQIALFKTGVTL